MLPSYDIFIRSFACSYFSNVLHFDVLRRQIELKLNVKTEISLYITVMLDHPWQSLYTKYIVAGTTSQFYLYVGSHSNTVRAISKGV